MAGNVVVVDVIENIGCHLCVLMDADRRGCLVLIYEARRPFLLPRVRALLRMAFILLSLVGDVGLVVESLPDRSV